MIEHQIVPYPNSGPLLLTNEEGPFDPLPTEKPKRKSHVPGPKKVIRKARAKHIPKAIVADMINRGYKHNYIANKLDISISTVNNISRIVNNNKKEIQEYNGIKFLVQDYKIKEIDEIDLLVKGSLKKKVLEDSMKTSDLVSFSKALDFARDMLFKQSRLLTGKSTQNIVVFAPFMREAINEI